MQPVQDLTHRRHGEPDAVPVHPAGRRSGRARPEWTPKLVDKLRELPELGDVTSDISARGLSVFVDIDRDQAAPASASRRRRSTTRCTIPTASASSRRSSPIRTSTAVILEADPSLQKSLDSLSSIYLPSSVGSTPVPLSVMAKMRVETAPLQVSHLGQFPSATVSFNLAPGASLGERGDRDQAGAARDRPAARHDHELPGRGAGVPVRRSPTSCS